MRLARSISLVWYTPSARFFNEYYKLGLAHLFSPWVRWKPLLQQGESNASIKMGFSPGGHPVPLALQQRMLTALSLGHCVKKMHHATTGRV
jgi:hypothetical protein